ncbi:hypothetical protein DFH07DRAFT_1004220 [Mycena maculata]|uniref:Restriction of telomere capping protein 4 C-terminal domain-containing protein n=1 Tax=Mycena maculata TaxID=230809 RepID=A0AAD7JR60_9AGAR|nr:hypothetical protein DFH07DRAFT_1004220 [Mycena maculata]
MSSRLISSTITRMFSSSWSELKERLQTTLQSIITAKLNTQFDNEYRKQLPAVLQLRNFIPYVLTPHVVNCLISQDIFVSVSDAIDIKNASHDFGDMFQWNLKDPHLISLCQTSKEFSDYEIDHPIRLPPYSPIRNWNTNSFNSISPSHLKAADSHTSSAALSPVPSPALSPTAPSAKISPKPKPPNKSKGKEIDLNDTIELTIEDFPPAHFYRDWRPIWHINAHRQDFGIFHQQGRVTLARRVQIRRKRSGIILLWPTALTPGTSAGQVWRRALGGVIMEVFRR